MQKFPLLLGVAASLLRCVASVTIDINDKDSLITASGVALDNALTFYSGDKPGGTPGVPDPPYYWWEAGGLFGTMIQRWSITGNDTFNDMIIDGLQHQVGPDFNYEPTNQSFDLGNDDQLFWAFATLDAAELGFPNPPSGDPSWTALAQAVFNRQTSRWDNECGGGEHWQVDPLNRQYKYKNVISNGGYFQLAARLARYTGNNTYLTYAERTFDWILNSPLFDNDTTPLRIWDGLQTDNCSYPEEVDYSYNPATLLIGAAYLYNYTNGSSLWEQRVNLLVNATDIFFVQSAGTNAASAKPQLLGNIMSEIACEFSTPQSCNQDMPSFKAYTSRWLAMTTVLAPFTKDVLWPRLQASAQAAAGQCTGSAAGQQPGTSCGRRWYQTTWDGFYGLGEHMSAMSVWQNLLIDNAKTPVTLRTGGTSKSDPGLGNAGNAPVELGAVYTDPITTGDMAGAGILTILGVGLAVAGSAWMVLPEGSSWQERLKKLRE